MKLKHMWEVIILTMCPINTIWPIGWGFPTTAWTTIDFGAEVGSWTAIADNHIQWYLALCDEFGIGLTPPIGLGVKLHSRIGFFPEYYCYYDPSEEYPNFDIQMSASLNWSPLLSELCSGLLHCGLFGEVVYGVGGPWTLKTGLSFTYYPKWFDLGMGYGWKGKYGYFWTPNEKRVPPNFSLKLGWQQQLIDSISPERRLFVDFAVGFGKIQLIGIVHSPNFASAIVWPRDYYPAVRPSSSILVPLGIWVNEDDGIIASWATVAYSNSLNGPGKIRGGAIGGKRFRTIYVPVKISADAVPGVKTIIFSLEIRGVNGEWYADKAIATIRVVSAAAKPVAVFGLQKEKLCDLILPVSEAEAEYKAEYSGTKLTILNLTTGQRKVLDAFSEDSAVKALNSYFEGGDLTPPEICLSVLDGANIPAESLQLTVYLSDDKLLGNIRYILNNQEIESIGLGDKLWVERTIIFPLNWGDNTLRFVVADATGLQSVKEVVVTRIRGEGVYIAREKSCADESPELVFEVSPSNPANALMGGTMGGITVIIHNRGKGYAKQVNVVLSGDQTLAGILGSSKEIEEIAPDDSVVIKFSRLLPDNLERKQARINISVFARDYTATEVKGITFNLFSKPEDVDNDVLISGIRRNGHALIVGITQYQRTNGPQYASNDALIFKEYTEKVIGIPTSNITILLDEEATWRTIYRKIRTIGNQHGFLIVYFAGHGSFDAANPTSGKAFLAPYDWIPDDDSSLLSVDDILGIVDPGSGDTTLVFLDACFAGGEGRSVEYAARPAVIANLPTEHSSILMASSEGYQISNEFENARHGLFTYFLLNGLRGNAEGQDGWIYLDDLYNYVRQSVIEISGGKQTPILRGRAEGIIVGRARQ